MSFTPAPREFAEFACATRADWSRPEFDGALAAIGNARPGNRPLPDHWQRTVNTILPMLWDEAATPLKVRDLARGPLDRAPAAGPVDVAAVPGMDEALAACAEASAAMAAKAGDSR